MLLEEFSINYLGILCENSISISQFEVSLSCTILHYVYIRKARYKVSTLTYPNVLSISGPYKSHFNHVIKSKAKHALGNENCNRVGREDWVAGEGVGADMARASISLSYIVVVSKPGSESMMWMSMTIVDV